MESAQAYDINGQNSFANRKHADKQKILIGSDIKLSITDAYLLSEFSLPIDLHTNAGIAIEASYQFLKKHVDLRIPIYGVNTNFGDQVRYIDSSIKEISELSYQNSIVTRQENIIKSLSCGLGDIVDPNIVRVTMMLRAHCLAKGHSGVHPQLIAAVLAFINAGITPVVRCYGSIGASGDLIPLSMIAAAIIGENVAVHYKNEIMMAPEAIRLAGLTRYKPVHA